MALPVPALDRAFLAAALCLPLTLALSACPAKEEKKEEKKEKKAELPEVPDEPEVELPKLDLSGPLPPEASATFFAVDGAMIPLGCFDAEKKKLMGGKDCLALVKAGDGAYLASETGAELDEIGEPKNALCEVADEPTSLGTPSLNSGKAYTWGTSPKSLGRIAETVSSKAESNEAVVLSDEEKAIITTVLLELAPKIEDGKDELRATQRAEFDVDGDGKAEKFTSVVVPHPARADQYLFSGLLMARGGDLADQVIVDQTKRFDMIKIRGGVDLDGDGIRELWVGLVSEGLSADKMVHLDGENFVSMGKWTCGA